MEKKEKETQEKNHIRLGFSTRVGNVIRYVNMLLKEGSYTEVKFSAIGGAIGSLVNAVEVIKTVNQGFYQVNTISTVSHQTVDSHNNVLNTRLSPKMEVVLTKVEPKTKTEGFQDKLSEEDRIKLLDLLNTNTSRRQGGEGQRGRGGQRTRSFRGGNFRGGRGQRDGGFRGGDRDRPYRDGRQGGFRGDREFRDNRGRGGPRGFRGDRERGGPHRGFRGDTGRGFRGNTRGFRDNSYGDREGSFRGNRDRGFRGGNRGFRDTRGGYNRGGSRGGRYGGQSYY